jgi:hypothetical protein
MKKLLTIDSQIVELTTKEQILTLHIIDYFIDTSR